MRSPCFWKCLSAKMFQHSLHCMLLPVELPNLTWGENISLLSQGQPHGLLGSWPEVPHGTMAWLFSFLKQPGDLLH